MYNLTSISSVFVSSLRTSPLFRACRSICLSVSLVLLASANISHASTPYSGTPIAIPGTIEMEDYDLGGEGDAYHDVDAGNNGPASYRTDDVDHEACTDGGAGYNVGWTVAGEWLKYTVNVASNGSYTMTARVASEAATGAFHIEVDGVDVTGTIAVGNTGGWQTWVDKTSTFSLSAGQHVVKLVVEGSDFNINRMDITYNGPPPEEPTGLQVDSTGVNSVTLSWTAPAAGSPTGYNVKRATTSNGTYTVVGTTTAPTVAFTDSVTGGSTYYYVVSAQTAGGESADSSFVSATPTLGVPAAPADLAAIAGNNQVALSWTAPIGSPTSYNVMRSTTSGSGYSAITTPGAQTTTSYTDTTAVNGTTYYYVVSAVNAIGEGAQSTETDAAPTAFSGVYEPFDYPAGSLSDGTAATGIGLSGNWTCGTAGTVVSGLSYPDLPVVDNALSSSGGRQFATLASPLSSGTKWISFLYKIGAGDPGATINGVYFPNGGTGLWFGFGLSPYSASQGQLGLGSMNTTGTSATGATSLTHLGLGTYGTTYLVVMKIEFNTSGDNDTVTVYLNPVANQQTPGVAAAGTVSSFDVGTISGVGLNVVAATTTIDEIRTGDTYGEAVNAVTAPPNAPTGLNATVGTNLVSLSWTAATGIPSSYNIKRSSSSGGPYTTIDTVSVPTVTYEESIIGGQTYYYVVSAVNVVGESADSAPVAASPILTAPDAPAGLSASATNAQVSLSWSASTYATGYDVKRAVDINGPYVFIGSTAALTYDDTDGLVNATTYYYVVSATGAGGSSVDTSPVSATPFGPMPFVLTIDSGLGIVFFASNNISYQVQWSSEDLGANTVWNNLGESIPGDGETNTVFDPAGPTHNVYQVISIQ